MTSPETPKTAPEKAGPASKNGKAPARPSQTAQGEALRANLRRRKDQARARAVDGGEAGAEGRPGDAPGPEE